MKIEHVAVGIFINKNNQVLIAQRPVDKHQGGKWEFPGGKVESGETSQQALSREMREELGIEVQSAVFLTNISHEYNDKKVILDFYIIKQWKGEARGMEHQPVLWVEKHELANYEFPEANTDIIKLI